jgi:rhamnulokinase
MNCLACDLGAESGRLMLGRIERERLSIDEVHRFPNVPLQIDGSLCWDIHALWRELQNGLHKAGALKVPIASVSADSWGLDYVLLDETNKIIEPAFHYRDARTARGVEKLRPRIDWSTLFAETGIQFMPFNTVYQLAAESSERLERARKLLLIGDAFNWQLSGVATTEESLASTSAIYNPRRRDWSTKVIAALGVTPKIFTPIVPSGTKLGHLRGTPGLGDVEVIASCSHDTGAAVAAVPAASTADSARPWAYISSGTWSLMGVEVTQPVLTDLCRELNFTNEIGHGGTVRLLKNIVGLWTVQECRREWGRQGRDYDYATLTKMAGEVPAPGPLINPADPRFVAPGDMPGRIAKYCVETGQIPPDGVGETIRCALESLALQYRKTLRELERLTGTRLEELHIVGGGSQNRLLNQFTANATGIPVMAGPTEATAIGNVLVQAIAMGELDSLWTARELVRRSFEMITFEPREQERWNGAAETFAKLK